MTNNVGSFGNTEYGSGVVPPPIPGGTLQAQNLVTNPPTVATPGVPAASTYITNTTGVDVDVYILTAGTASAISVKDKNGVVQLTAVTTVVGQSIYLPAGWQIQLGAYTVAPTWAWVPV